MSGSWASGGQVCWHCGKKGHLAEHCRFINAVCYRCHKKGHIEARCKTRPDRDDLKWMNKQETRGHEYHVIDTLSEETIRLLFKSQGTSYNSAYLVKMEIN